MRCFHGQSDPRKCPFCVAIQQIKDGQPMLISPHNTEETATVEEWAPRLLDGLVAECGRRYTRAEAAQRIVEHLTK